MSEIKERPILFSAPMVRAILEGRKTVTRRPLNDRALKNISIGTQIGECHELPAEGALHPNSIGYYNDFCPFGQPGERLWVRETWFCNHLEVMRGPYLKPDDLDIGAARDDGTLVYAADGLTPYEQEQPVWRPSIHMPRWASRILLEITGVRVERLQDIDEDQIQAEGIGGHEFGCLQPYDRDGEPTCDCGSISYEESFQRLWSSTGGDWDVNPWVWVVEFKQVTP
ncbi:hypothetical protein NYP20_16395 [Pseudomonas sp. N3-W]|uniref:hypothetical protein n=1 Tax=Pseudomonas sp. N3-W TaxID=2975049 RepID=UPI00217DAF92|nr:hypothetical protein [Pseudomonas sp. N3-W]UWF46930.1 hypothetical protein NYP20_16395 [Pseudomonas sp. N3-W]